MADALERAFHFYLANQDRLVDEYRGKFIVIKDDHVLGAYDDEVDAIRETLRDHPPGTFLVQKCLPGTEAYTQTYHSRVAFV